MSNLNEFRPFQDYTDLALTVGLALFSYVLMAYAFGISIDSFEHYFWFFVSILPIVLIAFQTLKISKNKPLITLIIKGVITYFVVYAILFAIIGLMLAVAGSLQSKNAQYRRPENGETLPEYISKRNRERAEGEQVSSMGSIFATVVGFLLLVLSKYIVKTSEFSPISKWMKNTSHD
jgi:hypothetical protein